ncbi:hypothetical protein [Paraliomyxa miuraensis]|uniref:hypothetical protein n=1 Tax=Paraliomyxa miuraensis TaxID=376150 RepID=UPI002252507F|nr:hypothetical protein [Paraliomyxa miuraensis]MCX4242463.1 hypothetical protein [Paraliomyxa miuraensis]
MLRRRIADLRLLSLPLSLSLALSLQLAGCQKPPATDTTTPTDASAQADANAPAEPAEAPLPAADEVLARSIDAVGGADAIAKIESSYTEAKTEIKAQGISLVTRIWSKGKDFYVESDMPGVGLSQVWKKGDEIWSKDPINGMRKLEGKEAAQTRWSSDPMLAANWREYFEQAKTLGRSKDGERSLVEVELSGADGAKLVLMFDEATGLPAGQSFEQQTPMGSLPIRITVDDYREIKGVKFPFRSVTDMQLMSAVQVTEKLEVNVEIDDAKFEVPTKAPAEAAPASDKKGKADKKSKAKSG